MPNWTKSPDKPLRISFLLFERFSNLCLANCLEPMRAANSFAAWPVYDWNFLSPDGAPVQSSSGLPVMPQAAPETMGRRDITFVLSSYDHMQLDTPKNRQILRHVARNSAKLVALDSAPWLLGSAGLLDGRRATIHWDLLDSFTERFHRIQTEQAQVVHDGTRVTCAGALSTLDMTLDMIRDHLGEAMRLDIEALFIRNDPPAENPAPTLPVQGLLVRRAMQIMQDNLERPIPLPQLAQMLAIQPRTLDRRFRASLGAPAGQVYLHLRLTAARQMVQNSGLTVADIALRVGYETPAAFTRAYRGKFSQTPSQMRF